MAARVAVGEQVSFIHTVSPFLLPLISVSALRSSSLFDLQEFTTSGTNNTDTGKSGGHLETKYKLSDLGLTFNQKWNTDNTLTTEITMEDQVESNVLHVYETVQFYYPS